MPTLRRPLLVLATFVLVFIAVSVLFHTRHRPASPLLRPAVSEPVPSFEENLDPAPNDIRCLIQEASYGVTRRPGRVEVASDVRPWAARP